MNEFQVLVTSVTDGTTSGCHIATKVLSFGQKTVAQYVVKKINDNRHDKLCRFVQSAQALFIEDD